MSSYVNVSKILAAVAHKHYNQILPLSFLFFIFFLCVKLTFFALYYIYNIFDTKTRNSFTQKFVIPNDSQTRMNVVRSIRNKKNNAETIEMNSILFYFLQDLWELNFNKIDHVVLNFPFSLFWWCAHLVCSIYVIRLVFLFFKNNVY